MAERERRRRGSRSAPPGAGTSRVYGLHAARAVLAARPAAVRRVHLLERAGGALAGLEHAARAHGVTVEHSSRAALDALTGDSVHQGIVLEVQPLEQLSLTDFEELVAARLAQLRLLVLDQIEDPRNLGACLRSAAAAGVDAVVVPKDRSASLSPAATKAAAGAAELVPVVRVTNLARTLRFLSSAGVWLAGAAAEAPLRLWDARLSAPLAIVLGSEGAGLRRLTRECCDELFSIPMPGTVESLNVSVTAGIVLFEALRRG